MIRRAFLLIAAVLVSRFPAGAQGVQLPGSLDWLLTDAALFSTPVAEMPAKYQAAGYVKDPMTSAYASLGTPKQMMEKKAHLFLPEMAVWKVTFNTSDKVRSVVVSFMPPPEIAKLPDRAGFRGLARRLEEGLTARFKSPGADGQMDSTPQGAAVKSSSRRWAGPQIQAVLTTVAADKGSVFTPQRLELKLLPSVPPGKPVITKAPVAKMDKTTGAMILEGMPAQVEWDGHLPQWLPLEQALHAVGRTSDRNTIIDCPYSTGYAFPFTASAQRIAAGSGAKVSEIMPLVYHAAERERIAKACDSAAKKLGKNSPEKFEQLTDVDLEVVRAARAGASAVAAFTGAVKQSLAAGRPLYWYGWTNYMPENPREDGGAPGLVTRLIIGYAAKENEVIFADASGQPGIRMKAGDALAAGVWVAAFSAK